MKVLSVASARPNFVKLAAVHYAIASHPDIEHVILHTGQHYDPLFSDIFFEQLSIPLPTENLGIAGGTREEVIERTEQACLSVLKNIRPDTVLVYGDVNGALGAARAAKSLGIRIGHVEAGLRSFDLSMPEELNRIEIDGLADHLFCSEESGVSNLQNEHTTGEIHLVGNTMIDTLIRMHPEIQKASVPEMPKSPYATVTLHRPSNVDTKQALSENLQFLAAVGEHLPLLFPLHHRVKAAMSTFSLTLPPNIIACEPFGYIPFLHVVQNSEFLLTDSGGIQEEATFLQKRCFTLRRNTERPSTIESGSNVLIDPASTHDRKLVLSFAKTPTAVCIETPALWDGKAGERICKHL